MRPNVCHASPTSFLLPYFSYCLCLFLGCRCLLRLSVLPWNMKQANARRRKSCEKRKRRKKEKEGRIKTRIWNMRKIKLLTKIIYVMVCSKCVCVCVWLSVCVCWFVMLFTLTSWQFFFGQGCLKIYATLWTAVVLYILTRKEERKR